MYAKANPMMTKLSAVKSKRVVISQGVSDKVRESMDYFSGLKGHGHDLCSFPVYFPL